MALRSYYYALGKASTMSPNITALSTQLRLGDAVGDFHGGLFLVGRDDVVAAVAVRRTRGCTAFYRPDQVELPN
jgi:hypothetical protein